MVQEPTKPQKIKIVEVIGSSVQLSWEPPKDDGNTEIIGYAVEKRDKRSQDDGFWYIVHERVSAIKYFGVKCVGAQCVGGPYDPFCLSDLTVSWL